MPAVESHLFYYAHRGRANKAITANMGKLVHTVCLLAVFPLFATFASFAILVTGSLDLQDGR